MDKQTESTPRGVSSAESDEAISPEQELQLMTVLSRATRIPEPFLRLPSIHNLEAMVDLAIEANGGAEKDDAFCSCVPNVSTIKCSYCIVREALNAMKLYLQEIGDNNNGRSV